MSIKNKTKKKNVKGEWFLLHGDNDVLFVISDELRFKEEPNDVTVTFGGSAFFTCKVEGNQNVKVIWTRDK